MSECVSREAFIELFSQTMTQCALDCFSGEETADRFYTLTAELLRVSAYMNLTAIKTVPEIILKHYADSLTIAAYIPENALLLDVGCGAGFPCLPLALIRPDVKINALDSTKKKLDFIDGCAGLLGLSNISTLSRRAEEAGHEWIFREKYGVVTARAVAPLRILCEWCLPFAAVGGRFIAMKGNSAREELSEAENAIATLGGKHDRTVPTRLVGAGNEAFEHYNIIIQKTSNTPIIYPRINSKTLKNPL